MLPAERIMTAYCERGELHHRAKLVVRLKGRAPDHLAALVLELMTSIAAHKQAGLRRSTTLMLFTQSFVRPNSILMKSHSVSGSSGCCAEGR